MEHVRYGYSWWCCYAFLIAFSTKCWDKLRKKIINEIKLEQVNEWDAEKLRKLVSLVFSAGYMFRQYAQLEGSVTQDFITGFSTNCEIYDDVLRWMLKCHTFTH